MIYDSNHPDDFMWYLILREKKLKHTGNKVPSHFQWSEQKNHKTPSLKKKQTSLITSFEKPETQTNQFLKQNHG